MILFIEKYKCMSYMIISTELNTRENKHTAIKR